MPASEFVKALDGIQRALRPALKQHGFRPRGRTFNRLTDDGLTQVINLQMGASDPPGTTYLPGLRKNMYGLFTVNLGIYIPEVAELHGVELPRRGSRTTTAQFGIAWDPPVAARKMSGGTPAMLRAC